MFDKLSKINVSELKKWNISPNEIAYLKNKILNDKLGLVLNFEEKDENLENYYFGLEEVKELHINPKEKNNHLLIEGDNYYALKALQISGIKVDVIYIDPPYNTGNKDFIYNDNYVNKDDQFKHSKWLSFMKKRLELAKELLADDGVIFVSIDDNEQAYLKVLMDEIFGEENFICNFIIKLPDGNNINKLSVIHEYCLMYSKSKSFSINNLKTPTIKKELIESRLTNKGNIESTIIFPKGLKIEGGGDHCFKNIVGGKQEIIKLSSNMIFKNGLLVEDVELTAEWRSPNILKKLFSNPNEKIFDNKGNQYLLPFFNSKGNPKINKIRESTNIRSCLEFSTGTKTLQKLSLNFNYSKSVEFVSFIISLINKKELIILDFFAGSGTTAQAIMELNEKDKCNRRFILCTNNENNIARNLTWERIYRIIYGQGSKNEKIDWTFSSDKKSLGDNCVKYLKVKSIDKVNGEYEDINNLKKTYQNEFNKDLSIKDFK